MLFLGTEACSSERSVQARVHFLGTVLSIWGFVRRAIPSHTSLTRGTISACPIFMTGEFLPLRYYLVLDRPTEVSKARAHKFQACQTSEHLTTTTMLTQCVPAELKPTNVKHPRQHSTPMCNMKPITRSPPPFPSFQLACDAVEELFPPDIQRHLRVGSELVSSECCRRCCY